ncbi:TRAP transporter substrate-binding protein DctP [Glaciibacter sp. 2TAF33]|uniref:TRAP transporter substrate-binding protein DctP n=1 Tax=Glaciibacter sp. 2TAF33 TaxID=3233015 RepID=UPI003F913140
MSRMRRTGSVLAGLVGLTLIASGCSAGEASSTAPATGGDAFAEMEPLELTFNHTNPPGGHFEAATVAFTDYIEEATGGKVTFESFYSGSLLPAAEAFAGVGSGLADVSYTTTIGFENQFPIADWLSPAMSDDPQPFPLGDLANYAAANDFIANEPAIQAEYEAQNVKPLWFVSSSPGDMLCTKPIKDLADAGGRLTRSPSARITAEVDALGMTSVSMPFADLYEGLQRGAINCVYTTAGNTTFKPYGLTEVAKYYAPVSGWTPIAAAGYIINLDLWESFSDDLRRVFQEASMKALSVHSEGAFNVVADFGATAKADGVQFLKTDDLRQVMSTLHAGLNSRLVKDAPAGVDHPKQLIKSLADYRAKWRDLLADGVVAELPGDPAEDGDGLRAAYAAGAGQVDWQAFLGLLQEQSAVTG